MLIQLNEAWERHDHIVRVEADYRANRIMVTCRDGHVHRVPPDYNGLLSDKETKIVAAINSVETV